MQLEVKRREVLFCDGSIDPHVAAFCTLDEEIT
jgi:hypothetical protein